MRSGAGAFCPGSLRLECLLDFFTRDLLAADAAGRAALRVGLLAAFPGAFAGADGADQATPAVRSSAKPAVIDVRSLIEASTISIATISSQPYLYREGRDSTIELLLVFRWYHTRQEHRKGAVGIAAAQIVEYDVHRGFQFGHCLLVRVDRGDRFAVDLGNDISASKAEVVREARRIDIGDQHAVLPFHADARGAFRREAIHAQTELGWRGLFLLAVQATGLRRENARTVFDHRGGFLLPSIANIGQFHLAANRCSSDRIHEIVAVFHGSAIHAGNDVAALESGLFRRAAGLNIHDDHAIRRAQFLQCDGVSAQIFLEADADGAARYAALRNNLIVDVDRGGRWQRKAHALVAAAAGNDGRVDADHL